MIGEDMCHLKADMINVTCVVHYGGSVAPAVVWYADDVLDKAEVLTTVIPNKYSSSTLLISASYVPNGHSFSCGLTLPVNGSSKVLINYPVDEDLRWISEQIRTIKGQCSQSHISRKIVKI